MSTVNHTPGPLRVGASGTTVILANNAGGFDLRGSPNADANARRIVAMWNACIDEDLAFLEGIVQLENSTLRKHTVDILREKEQYMLELNAMERHRDLLLAACQDFVRKCDSGQAKSVKSYAMMKRAIRGEE